MKKDTEKTVVVFRRYKEGDIIALFPLDINYPDGCCESYQHIGQHGAADYYHVVKGTKPAQPFQYANLQRELEGRGYNLEIRSRKQSRGC